MRKIVILALKGVLRRTTRSGPVILIIATAVLSVHLTIGFILGSLFGLQFSIVHGGTGHLQIGQLEQFMGYTDGGVEHTISLDQQAAIKSILDGRDVRVFAEMNAGGLASNGEKTVPFSGLGLDVGADTRLRRSVSPVLTGQGLRNSKGEDFRATIGQILAEQLSLDVGDAITLLTTTKQNAINAIDLTVVGLISTGNRFNDAVLIEMPLRNIQFLLDTEDVSRFVVYNDGAAEPVTLAAELNAQLPDGLQALTWREVEPIYDQIRQSNLAQFTVLAVILSMVVFISLLSAISASILERKSQIGVLLALGMRRRAVMGLFLGEGVILSLIGGIVGLSMSFAVSRFLDGAGIMLPPPPGQNVDVPLVLFWDAPAAAFISLGVIALASLAAALTVSRLFKRSIIDLVEG
ncbi:FtsX-like permease family protein [Phaeobacter sp.]|uniref:ABC transporter permease n=1 Tax=Phaeobacter sp. TaxID=1902409 RepID=UPI0025D74BB8|nr:FtsX-like permease family protein [Phaeobacter sp.]